MEVRTRGGCQPDAVARRPRHRLWWRGRDPRPLRSRPGPAGRDDRLPLVDLPRQRRRLLRPRRHPHPRRGALVAHTVRATVRRHRVLRGVHHLLDLRGGDRAAGPARPGRPRGRVSPLVPPRRLRRCHCGDRRRAADTYSESASVATSPIPTTSVCSSPSMTTRTESRWKGDRPRTPRRGRARRSAPIRGGPRRPATSAARISRSARSSSIRRARSYSDSSSEWQTIMVSRPRG